MREGRTELTPGQRDELAQKSGKLQTQYLIDLVNLCDEYGIKRTPYIRSTVNNLKNYVEDYTFESMNIKEGNK